MLRAEGDSVNGGSEKRNERFEKYKYERIVEEGETLIRLRKWKIRKEKANQMRKKIKRRWKEKDEGKEM